MLIHWIWLAELSELSLRQKLELLERWPDAEDLFCADPDGFSPEIKKIMENKDLTDAEKIRRKCVQKGIQVLTYGDSAYPLRLRNIADPPLVLYYRGVLPAFEEQPVIAVVGTRKASPYGIAATKKLSRQIACCGGLVVSGGASGVDTAAMEGALETGNPVIGVLGCGVDVVYPKSNRKLFADTIQTGCLISEYPPGERPERWHFPQRNRIISGIANGVLVTEAPESSGALITARRALEQGRDVFAVPGNIDVASCAGSNGLLQDGAAAVLSGWDILQQYAALYPGRVENRPVSLLQPEKTVEMPAVAQKTVTPAPLSDKLTVDKESQTPYSGIEIHNTKLSAEEQQVVAALSREPRPVDEVIAQVPLPASKVLSLLTMLALKGVVRNHPGRLVSVNIPKV